MDNQTKFVLTVDASGAVVKVEQLGKDGSLRNIPVLEFFAQLVVPGGSFSGSGTLTVQPRAGTSDEPEGATVPIIRSPPPPGSRSPPKRPSPAPTPKKPKRK